MGRAPCCQKVGLKRGPWTAEEDQILINHVNKYGHSNWRALPKLAGLLRCGKSCRLRWINYLKPDIKRGNFTQEEEDTIIKLHEMLGNRWSAIAAKLPGRTDNEIKNVWHTHLKKRLPHDYQQNHPQTKRKPKQKEPQQQHTAVSVENNRPPLSPSHSSDVSTLTATNSDNSIITTSSTPATNNVTTNDDDMSININVDESPAPEEESLALDDDFWSEVLSADNSEGTTDYIPAAGGGSDVESEFRVLFSQLDEAQVEGDHVSPLSMGDDMDFWLDVYNRAEEFTEQPQLYMK